MNKDIKAFTNALLNKDYVDAKKHFNQIMATKSMSYLEQREKEIAKKLFNK